MPRKRFEFSSSDYYHLSARSNNREWFHLPTNEVWRICSMYLHFIHNAFGVQIGSFVLMNNHFHLLARFPEQTLSTSLQYFMRETSRSIARESGRINHVYGSRVFRSRISNFHHLRNVYKYVYRNPVEAGLVRKVEEYEFSTLHGLLGKSHLLIPVEEDELLFSEPLTTTIDWLNTAPDDSSRQAIRWGLRGQVFMLPKIKSSLRAHPLNDRLY